MERSSTKTRPYTITAPDGTELTGKWFRSKERFLKDKEIGEIRFLKKMMGTGLYNLSSVLPQVKR